MKNYREIRSDLVRLAKKINLPSKEIPMPGVNPDLGGAYILIQDNLYLYLATERGQETSRFETSNYDELLYLVFNDLTFHYASYLYVNSEDYSLSSDQRIYLFALQEEMMKKLSSKWAKRCKKENDDCLRQYP